MKENILFIILMSLLFLSIYNRITDKDIEQPQEIGFEQSFKDARSLLGKEGIFVWNGKRYTTLYKEEI